MSEASSGARIKLILERVMMTIYIRVVANLAPEDKLPKWQRLSNESGASGGVT